MKYYLIKKKGKRKLCAQVSKDVKLGSKSMMTAQREYGNSKAGSFVQGLCRYANQ